MKENAPIPTSDTWESLRKFTAARIALGRAGNSIPLKESLQFKLAHAHARDAVYSLLEQEALLAGLRKMNLPALQLHSQAKDRAMYLQRPDLGRILDESSSRQIRENSAPAHICVVIGDGLSATAVNQHALPLLEKLVPALQEMRYTLSPICLARQARVALADPVASGLQANLSLMLIGERPGLSAANSMGAYLTYQPRPGLTDESRNCISNIRPEGIPIARAAEKIAWFIQEAFSRKLSGVHLKDNFGMLEEPK